jgi:hypothetical protein
METLAQMRRLLGEYAAMCRGKPHPRAVETCRLFDSFVALYDPWARGHPDLVTDDNFLKYQLTDRASSSMPVAIRDALRRLTDCVHLVGADPGVPDTAC